jgi:phosphoenolpyruvate synthase/pyruvate phosphate dikinase
MKNKFEIFEIAPTPSKFTINLLNLIYKKDGPIDKVYKKFHINYKAENFLVYKNNNLWVDKDKEQKSLPMNIRNIFFLSLINLNDYNSLFDQLKKRLNKEEKVKNENWSKLFLDDYELVFEINLKFNKAVKNLEINLKKDQQKIVKLLTFGKNLVKDIPDLTINTNTSKYVGNSIEITDKGKFTTIENHNKSSIELEKWWSNLDKYKKTLFEKSLRMVFIYSKLREYSRWLIVKNISIIRNSNDPNIKKITNNKSKIQKTKKTNKTTNQEIMKITGVSAGIAEGILVSVQELDKYKNNNKILFTSFLSPNLTDLLEKIEGIVSTTGGIMSHMAIVSREMKKPVIVGFILNNEIKIGDNIRINGTKGTIEKLD